MNLQISGDIPDASPDRHSIRSPTPSYVDPSIPGMLTGYIFLYCLHVPMHS
jgi:cellulose synthase A